jgi:hypothetical protein
MVLNDVILKAGGEGGSIVLYGLRVGSGWSFSLDFIVPEPTSPTFPNQDVVDTWEDAIALLDRYDWYRLRPVRLHPDFRERILDAVAARIGAGQGQLSPDVRRWEEAEASDSQVKGRVHSSDAWLYYLVDDD